MKEVFVILAVLSLSFSLSASQNQMESPEATPAEQGGAIRDEEAMGKIIEDWKNAYNRGDDSAVPSLYTEDGYYLSAHILARGRRAIQAYWQRGVIVGGYMDIIKPLTTFLSGDLGYIAGTYQATNAGVTVDGRILIVFKKVNGKWLIAAHETVVRD